MRYTFNMLTMMKEKVNTHFSFPLRLDMFSYMEKNLISSDKLKQGNLFISPPPPPPQKKKKKKKEKN